MSYLKFCKKKIIQEKCSYNIWIMHPNLYPKFNNLIDASDYVQEHRILIFMYSFGLNVVWNVVRKYSKFCHKQQLSLKWGKIEKNKK